MAEYEFRPERTPWWQFRQGPIEGTANSWYAQLIRYRHVFFDMDRRVIASQPIAGEQLGPYPDHRAAVVAALAYGEGTVYAKDYEVVGG